MKKNIINSRSAIEPKQSTSRLAWENGDSKKEANQNRVSKRTGQQRESEHRKCMCCLLCLIILLVSALLAGVLFLFRKEISEIFASKKPPHAEDQLTNQVLGTTETQLSEWASTINKGLNFTVEVRTTAVQSSAHHSNVDITTDIAKELSQEKYNYPISHSVSSQDKENELTTPKVYSGRYSSLQVETTTKPGPALNNTIGNGGKGFIVLFMATGFAATKNVYVTSENGVQINITTSPRLNATLKSQIDQHAQIPSCQHFILPPELELQSFKKEVKSVLIETSNDVFVMTHDDALGSAGTTTHIPLYKLSTRYVVISTEPLTDSFSQLAVAAIQDNTIISITFKMKIDLPLNIEGKTFHDGEVFYLTLDRFETYQIQHITDLTGTLVESLAPIAVFSGNDCNKLENIGSCDHLIEQLPPTTSMDKTYIVPPNSDDRDTIIRITAIENSHISYTMNNLSQYRFLYERDYIDKKITNNQTCLIESRTSILVTAFGLRSKTSWFGDPSMTIVPGINQYLDYYKIVVPSGYDNNYASLIIKKESKGSLRINGAVIKQSDIVFEDSITAGNVTYNVRSIRVAGGELTAYSVTGERFGLILAGAGDQEAYGFSGNSLLP